MTPRSQGACPSEDELRSLLECQGNTTPPDHLEVHVETCHVCQQRLEAFCLRQWLELEGESVPPPSDRQVVVDEEDFVRDMVRVIPCPGRFLEGAAASAPADEIPRIPGFERLEFVGQGGSGEVYRGWQPELQRWVAIKTLAPSRSPERKARVIREARLLGRLQHPHIVRIHGVGELQGQPYLVMEWIRGGSLQERIRQGPLPIRDAARLAWEIASALAEVHAAGIVHRDLKPANVLLEPTLSPEGSGGDEIAAAKLTDFSIAFESEDQERLSQTGLVIGTPDYMAPEQTGLVGPPGKVGPVADLYGVGAVLYAMLTGHPPHRGATSLEVLRQVATEEPASPRGLRREIPPDLETIVGKCLRKHPPARYQSAAELADDLRRYLQGLPILARPYSTRERLGHWARRHPAMVLGLTLAGCAAGLTAGLAWYHDQQQQVLKTALAQRTEEAQQASAVAEASRTETLRSRVETLRSRWQMVEQLIQKAEVQLREEVLAPEQERGLVETVRRHLANQIRNRETQDEQLAWEFAETVDRWTALEEQQNFLSEALADGQLLDHLAPNLGGARESQSLFLTRDLREVRVLDGLRRFAEAGSRLEQRLSLERRTGKAQDVARVMQAVAEHGRTLQEAGQAAEARLWVQRGLEPLQQLSSHHPSDLALAVTVLELRLLELELLPADRSGESIDSREAEWLTMLRAVFSQQRRWADATSLEPVRLAQRLTGLVGPEFPRLVRASLEIWRAEIGELAGNLQEAEQHEAELIVQQLAWETEAIRLAKSPGGPQLIPPQVGPRGLEQAVDYVDRHPDEVPTRHRVADLLVHRAGFHLDHEPAAALGFAHRAIALLTPRGDNWRLASGGRLILSAAHLQEALALSVMGRLEEARQALELALSHSRNQLRGPLLMDLMKVQLALGQRSAATETAGKIADPRLQNEARRWLRETPGQPPPVP